jgi:hypothetical protein
VSLKRYSSIFEPLSYFFTISTVSHPKLNSIDIASAK